MHVNRWCRAQPLCFLSPPNPFPFLPLSSLPASPHPPSMSAPHPEPHDPACNPHPLRNHLPFTELSFQQPFTFLANFSFIVLTFELHVFFRLLRIVCNVLGFLKNFSPSICEIILDDGMDIDEYTPLFGLGFSAPALDNESAPSFGTLLSCLNVCLGHMHAVWCECGRRLGRRWGPRDEMSGGRVR